MINADETGRYKKRTDSNVSKIKNKSKHKHQYADVLISVGPSNSLYTGEICTICGKIKNLRLATGKIEINGKIGCRMLTNEETKEKYKELKEYHIDNLFQKYVKLEEMMEQLISAATIPYRATIILFILGGAFWGVNAKMQKPNP